MTNFMSFVQHDWILWGSTPFLTGVEHVIPGWAARAHHGEGAAEQKARGRCRARCHGGCCRRGTGGSGTWNFGPRIVYFWNFRPGILSDFRFSMGVTWISWLHHEKTIFYPTEAAFNPYFSHTKPILWKSKKNIFLRTTINRLKKCN